VNILGFIDDPPRDGSLNMALDDVLARTNYWPEIISLMRLYRWQKPTLSCGYNQKIERRVHVGNCQKHGVDLVRRPTGGRELLHDSDLSFSLITYGQVQRESSIQSAREFFFKSGSVLVEGLRRIGVETTVGTGTPRRGRGDTSPCLASTARYEISSRGRKLIPMAQRLYRSSILIHGSIQLVKSGIPTASLMKTGDMAKMQALIDRSSVNVQSLIGREIEYENLVESLRRSYEAVFEGEIRELEIGSEILGAAEDNGNNWQIKLTGKLKDEM